MCVRVLDSNRELLLATNVKIATLANKAMDLAMDLNEWGKVFMDLLKEIKKSRIFKCS